MAAAIQEYANFVRCVATKNDRSIADQARFEVAGGADLRFVAHVDPAPIEDIAALAFEHGRIDERGAIDAKVMRFGCAINPLGGGAVTGVVHGRILAQLL